MFIQTHTWNTYSEIFLTGLPVDDTSVKKSYQIDVVLLPT